MKTIRPLVSINPEGWESKAKALLDKEYASPDPDGEIRDPEQWVLLEGRQHGSYDSPGLFVCMHRLGYDADIEKAAKKLEMEVQNTGKEQDGTEYIGKMQWTPALKLNASLGNVTMNPRQGIDLMLDVREAIEGNKTLIDAASNSVSVDRLKRFYDEIWTVRDPWRAEWLNAKFDEVAGGIQISYGFSLDESGELKPEHVEQLEAGYRKSDGYVDVTSANYQGMFTKGSRKKDLYFWHPRDSKVAGFDADSGGADLSCDRGPTSSDASLGVRAARVAKI